jgi:hypothetical protein
VLVPRAFQVHASFSFRGSSCAQQRPFPTNITSSFLYELLLFTTVGGVLCGVLSGNIDSQRSLRSSLFRDHWGNANLRGCNGRGMVVEYESWRCAFVIASLFSWWKWGRSCLVS